MDIIENGVKIPFLETPPPISILNNKWAMLLTNIEWVRTTLHEFLRYSLQKKIVANASYCVMPLQVKKNADKKSFIFDMSVLNASVQTNSLN